MNIIQKLKKNQFLFAQLVHRDFTQKYKRTVLGIAWSVLSPLLTYQGERAKIYVFVLQEYFLLD